MQNTLNQIDKKVTYKKRLFHHIKGEVPGPILVFFAGVHGNELAGVKGLNRALTNLDRSTIKGEIYGVYGNIKAINSDERFIEKDLNRAWTSKNLNALNSRGGLENEDREQNDLLELINTITTRKDVPIYFIDLHTTSSRSLPFITINDTLVNRKLSECFPVPIVLGIEEYLDGTLLSYLNTLGYVALGFEAGQHTDPLAIENCEAFINLTLFASGVLINNSKIAIQKHRNLLKSSSEGISAFFEIVFKYHIQIEEKFEMIKGFKSFQDIKKGELLAHTNGKNISSQFNAKIFMPLYQKSGEDGFFIIRFVPRFFLWLSKLLRKLNSDTLLTLLPGVEWQDKKKGVLLANLGTTRYLAKEIFHLFGYRRQIIDENKVLLYNRERVAKNRMYKKEPWF